MIGLIVCYVDESGVFVFRHTGGIPLFSRFGVCQTKKDDQF